MHLHRALTAVLGFLGRFTGVAVLLYGGWIFLANLIGALPGNAYDSPLVLIVILAFGLVGFLSALGFLLTFDGPNSWRTTKRRTITWILMLVSVLLPTSLVFLLVPLVVITALTILAAPETTPQANT